MELFKLFGTIAVDNSEAVKNIKGTTDEASAAEGKLSSILSGIGGAVAKVGTVVATGVAACAAAVGAITKTAVENYAEYEQLVGGVDTLFKESSAKVQEYAANAYSAAGMSANEYMSTVTSFSASLLQSLGGDTAAAAEIANMAIVDMSDNANKMGSSMGSIQNAYQGFAKQNYTMLDNLKLGYGGTKEEMERLLVDAEKLQKANGKTVTYSLNSFADIIDAIHVIQDEMGITGTTQLEASETIAGSLASTKAAWQNLLTGFAAGNQNLKVLINNVVQTATTAVRNLVPVIAQTLSAISAALPEIIGTIAEELPGLIEELLPGLISGAIALFVGLGKIVPELVRIAFSDLPYLISVALYESTNPAISSLGSLFLDIGEFWREVLEPAIRGVGEALGSLWEAVKPILSVFPELFTEITGVSSGFDIFREVCWWLEEALWAVSEKITEVASWISEHSEEIKGAIVGMWEGIRFVWETIGQPIWDTIMNLVGEVKDAFAEKMPAIKDFVSDCFRDIKVLWENNLKPCLEAIGSFIENVLAPIFDSVFNTVIAPAVDIAFKFIKSAWNDTLKPALEGICDFLTGVFTGNWEQAWSGISKISDAAMNGIINKAEAMVNGAITALNGLISAVNEAIGLMGGDFEIPEIGTVSLNRVNSDSRDGTKFSSGNRSGRTGGSFTPQLASGDVLERGQVGLLGGSGAEMLVPLENNRAWISKVAEDTNVAHGAGSKQVEELREEFGGFVQALPDMMVDAFSSMRFDVNNREFARMVKAVN